MDHPSHAIWEILFLSFSTGQPHPLAEQPIIFIDKKDVPFDDSGIQIEIVGDFLILLVSFSDSSGFFLVRWKSGQMHCVSIQDHCKLNLSTIADALLSACISRIGDLYTFRSPLARHPRDSKLGRKYIRSSQDCDR